ASRRQSMAVLLTSDMSWADDVLCIGSVKRVFAPGNEREDALAFGRKIAAKSAYAGKIGKKAFYQQLEGGLKDAYRYATEVMVENMLARDVEEGIDAFLDKRAPKWEDR